jgi:transcriptional regulator GlxA family with amidase domain
VGHLRICCYSPSLRVEAAQQMVDTSNMGLKEIADACGFRTADAARQTFSRVIGIRAGE